MDGTCDLDRRDCTEDATAEILIESEDDDILPHGQWYDIVFESCDAHIPWFKKEYGEERPYTVTVNRYDEE